MLNLEAARQREHIETLKCGQILKLLQGTDKADHFRPTQHKKRDNKFPETGKDNGILGESLIHLNPSPTGR